MSVASLPARRVGAAVVAAAAFIALTGCSSNTPSEGSEGSPGDTSGVFPVTIDHMYGSTTIAAEPTKIVTLGLSDQDPLLALGVAPVAVSEWYGGYPNATWPWAQDELAAIDGADPIVLADGVRDEANPPIEEIAALEPDLILSLYNGLTESQYDQLSMIAPTVVPTEEFADFTITWQEATRVTGQALGREQDALELVAELDEKFADAAADHPQFAGVTTVVAERFESDRSVVRTGNDARARFFEQLGFTIPTEIAGARPDEYGEIEVSDELLPELSQGLLVWNLGSAPEERAVIEAQPLYQTLPVVRDGKVLWITDEAVSGAFSWGTILSLGYALDELLPQITGTVQ